MLIKIDRGARAIVAREREQRAIEMRRQGHTYAAIARELGVTDVAVIKMVRKVLTRTMTLTSEKAEEVKQLELERLDALINAHWEWAMKGDEKSSAIILRCMDRRAALMGLDAPKKVQVEEVSDIDRQLEQLVSKLKSGRQVPPTVEIDCTSQPVDPGGRLARLALPCGSRVGEDADRSGGLRPLRDEEPGSEMCPSSADLP